MKVSKSITVVVLFVQTWTWTFRFLWLWSCVVGLLVPYVLTDRSATILGGKQFKTIYLEPLDPLRWRHSDPSFETSQTANPNLITLSHPRQLNRHNSAVRPSGFMYVSVFLVWLWHFMIYYPVVGNTAQVGMLLPSGRWVICWFILMCWLAFRSWQLLPLSRISAQCWMTNVRAWWCWTRCAILVWKYWMACRSLPVMYPTSKVRQSLSVCKKSAYTVPSCSPLSPQKPTPGPNVRCMLTACVWGDVSFCIRIL